MKEPTTTPPSMTENFDVLFEIVNSEQHARVLVQTKFISEQSEPVQKLQGILQQVEAPFIGSYLSA